MIITVKALFEFKKIFSRIIYFCSVLRMSKLKTTPPLVSLNKINTVSEGIVVNEYLDKTLNMYIDPPSLFS